MTCLPTLERLSRLRVGVLGYGREGKSAVRALRRYRPDVDLSVLVETGEGPDDVPVFHGRFDHRLDEFDVVLRSPGVPVDHPALRAFRRKGGWVVNPSSIWFAERGGDIPVIGVTGSKGKSTTSALLAHLLEHARWRVLLAGNIGVPLLDHLDTAADAVVVELSSYQLADLEARLRVGLITRLFPEHLDWHGSSPRYYQAKLRIVDLLDDGGVLLVNAGDARLMEATREMPARVPANCEPGVRRVDDALYLGERCLARGEELALTGRHNLDNAAMALAAGMQLSVALETLLAGLESFRPLPHRLEPVATHSKVRWINDSIATSPHATLAALEALKGSAIILIAGGMDRPAQWQPVIDWCLGHGLKALITLPDNGPGIASAFRRHVGEEALPIESAASLEEAVSLAADRADAGDVVVLSPGAPSFPHFEDFEDRGRRFSKAVQVSG